ncbi:MAG: peptidylprolyl isomerase [Spirochaetes bacterium]|nr:MAG: peptidylprolyl isomerase [Spirochaetota bacterium]RKX84557.1 MAG: peptidylprolyl isomerase [Spirochaetota bacterium]
MTIIKDAVVTIDYTIKDSEGKIIESADGELLSYIHGTQTLAPGLEKALEGKDNGHRMELTLAPEEAFGVRDEELIREVSLEDFEDSEEVSPGLVFHADLDGEVRFYTVLSVEGDSVAIDGNHPFADKTLTFDVTVTEVREASEEELEHGHVHGEHGHHH